MSGVDQARAEAGGLGRCSMNRIIAKDRNVVGTAPSGGQRSAMGVALIDAVDAAELAP